MPNVKLYDPYKINDPTEKGMPAPVAGRTRGGKFNGFSQLAVMGDDHFPIESKYWATYARGAMNKLETLLGDSYDEVIDRIMPDNVIDTFSWRMICEMSEAAGEAVEKKQDPVQAAHKYLADKQYEIAMKQRKEIADDSNALSHWFAVNWELIPEVEY